MNKSEAIKNYGHLPLSFASYYKFNFSFIYNKKGTYIKAVIGGNADYIYEIYLKNKDYSLSEIESELGEIEFLEIKVGNNTIIDYPTI